MHSEKNTYNYETQKEKESVLLKKNFSSQSDAYLSLKDYLLILREKFWYFLAAFLFVVSISVIYCFKAVPLYEGLTLLQVLREDPSVLGVKSIESNDIKSVQDFNTQVKIIESTKMISSVQKQLNEEEREKLMRPYAGRNELLGPLTPSEIILKNRKIVPFHATLMVAVKYYHPDPEIASLVANLIANEYINYKVKLDVENSLKAVEDLKVRVDQQRLKVEEIEKKMAAYREKNGAVSLEARADIAYQELSAVNSEVVKFQIAYDEALSRKNMLVAYQNEDKDLYDIPFMHEFTSVESLILELAKRKIEIASLQERYGANHPKMIEQVQALEETKKELSLAYTSAIGQINNEYLRAKANYEAAVSRLHEKEEAIIHLGKISVEYNSLNRDLTVNQSLYESLVLRMNTELAQINLNSPNARIIDKAVPPIKPAKPNKLLVVTIGVFLGLLIGLSVAFLLAQLDDRVKSAFDIEVVFALPLLGVVPKIKRKNIKNKDNPVSHLNDRQALEAFRSIHSALLLNLTAKFADVILVTSTQPSEGKSFVATHLGSTFYSHNEPTLVIDADLRLPSIKVPNNGADAKGVIQFCQNKAYFDEIIFKDPLSGLHFIPSGGKSMDSTALLSSPSFKQLIQLAKEKYDRVIIDTPPIGLVSDALNVLSVVDCIIYIIKYNGANKRTIKYNIERIRDSDIPVAGAVINQVNTSMSDYYYGTYYGSNHKEYYTQIPKVTSKQPAQADH